MRFPFPPEEGADDLNPNRQRRCHGRGHRPCHSAPPTPSPPGAKSPRPAPAPPPAGASCPPGRALASPVAGGTGLGDSVARGRGKRSAFPVPARRGRGRSESEPPAPLPWQGPSPLPQRPADPKPAGGPKPPASARPAPGGRFSPAGSGAGLRSTWTADLRGTVAHGRGNAVRFLFPPGEAVFLGMSATRHLWQGPSPLPQRPADPWPAGGQKPPASARPAPGGRFSPAGSGAGLCWCGWHGSWWQRSARAGETQCVSWSRPERGGSTDSEPPAPLQWQGPSPLPQRPADPRPAGGPKPPASARPAPGGRFPPAGSGAGLRCAWTCRSAGNRLARAGKRRAFPHPARTDESPFTAAMAGAIAPATAPR
jgi:hypothetical protein